MVTVQKRKLSLQKGRKLLRTVSEIGNGLLTFTTVEVVSNESKGPIKSLLALMHWFCVTESQF